MRALGNGSRAVLYLVIIAAVASGVVADLIGAAHGRRRCFLWGFLLGPIGWIVVARKQPMGPMVEPDDLRLGPEVRTPAWNPDPFGRYHARWWDGEAWTADVTTLGPDGTVTRLTDPSMPSTS